MCLKGHKTAEIKNVVKIVSARLKRSRGQICMNKKNPEPLISILMAAYNSEKTIRYAIDSVLAQTYQNWELLVVDDCSSDNTLSIAGSYVDPRIRVFRNQSNSGVSRTRKKALDAAAGEWIAVLDSDDMWAPNKLEKQLKLAETYEAKLIFTGSAFVRDDGSPINWQLHVPEELGYRELLKQNLISNSSVLVENNLYRQYYVTNDKVHEDYALWLRITGAGTTAYGIDEPLLYYRLVRPSRSSNKLNAAKMRWNTYRFSGLDAIPASYYMCWYAVRGMLKYGHLLKG